MQAIYTFFENTIWATILLSILIYFTTHLNGTTKKISILLSLIPSLLIILSILLSGVTYSFYPTAIDGHSFRVIFVYLPLVILLIYFFTEDKKQNREGTMLIYSGMATIIFFMYVVYHPSPSGPSASNGFDEGIEDYPCQDEYYLIERNINLQMIDCAENIFIWAKKKKINICNIERNSDKTISASDENANYYLFSETCKFKKKEY